MKERVTNTASAGAGALKDAVNRVADDVKNRGALTVVAEQVRDKFLIPAVEPVVVPAVFVAGLAKGVHANATRPSPLSDSALLHAQALTNHLESGDKDAAKIAVTNLFHDAPDTKRKDLSDHLHGRGFVSEILADKIDDERANQGMLARTWGRVKGDTPKNRINSIHAMIDKIELPKTPKIATKSPRTI